MQREGGPIEEIRQGDVVWFEPGEKHWHGATPTTAMTHIAIQEKQNGSPVDWLEHYGADPVSVALEEVEPKDWTEAVYEPDIRGRWNTLYKKPGYDPGG